MNLWRVEGVPEAGISSAAYVLDQAVFQGLISRNDYDKLNDMRKYRNAIVHGFSVDGFSDKAVNDLIKAVRRMAKARVGNAPRRRPRRAHPHGGERPAHH